MKPRRNKSCSPGKNALPSLLCWKKALFPWFDASTGYETMWHRETAEAAMDDLEKALTGLRACESFIGAVLAD